MANPDRPNGARPKDRARRITEYVAGARVFPGDFVHMEDDGKVDPAVASEALLGVAASYADADGDKVLVWDDPDQKYIVQADGADIDDQTDFGLNYDIVATAGDTTYNLSRMELDSDTGAPTATLPLRALALEPVEGNALGAQAEVIVLINNHQLGKGTVGL